MPETSRNWPKFDPRWNRGYSRSGLHTSTKRCSWFKSLLYYFCNYQIIRERERERERNMVDSLKHKPQFLQKIKLVNEKDFNPNVVASFNYSNPSTIFAWAQIVEVERETHLTFLNLVQNKIY